MRLVPVVVAHRCTPTLQVRSQWSPQVAVAVRVFKGLAASAAATMFPLSPVELGLTVLEAGQRVARARCRQRLAEAVVLQVPRFLAQVREVRAATRQQALLLLMVLVVSPPMAAVAAVVVTTAVALVARPVAAAVD